MSAAKVKKIIITIVKYILLLITSFIAVLPLVSCVITAFKTPEEYTATSVMELPEAGHILKTLFRRGSRRIWVLRLGTPLSSLCAF